MTDPVSLTDLNDRLDSLWTSYLQYLDAYTTAQTLLQKHMSGGFLSLARANFNARDGVTRYGKDFYHDRAVPSRRAVISATTDQGRETMKAEMVSWEAEPEDVPTEGVDGDAGAEEAKQQPSPPATPEPESKESSGPKSSNGRTTEDTAPSEKPSTPKAKVPLASDPLRWFGILIPQQLRSAQASFRTATDEAVIDAVNASRSMRECEVDIRKLRKEIKRAEKAVAVAKEERFVAT
ncbi:hypothetical protein LTR09_009660 [Extremus antarcticus]|uniref:Vacuolar ATPase assembly protein VMA22 n=1 Tax=Extremus antarcticus TaxID=702011 RepID=A0AAJ0D8R7_9PEZI|nr:hypothetical protein LTR09_009660 [Extremus antarcticus]